MTIVSEHTVGTRRGVELVLLSLAVAIAMSCYAMVGIGVDPEHHITAGVAWYGLGFAVLAGGLHVLMRFVAPYADPVIVPIATALNGIGLAMIHRIDTAKLAKQGSKFSALAPKQLLYSAIGVILCALVLYFVRRHQILRSYTYISMVSSIVLLLLPLVPKLGRPVNGATIWIQIGSFTFQPAELTKIALTVFFAGYLVSNRDQLALAGRKVLGLQLPRGRDLGPLLVVWAVSVGVLVFQRDLGTSLLFFGLFVCMLYIATERISWVIMALALFGSGAFFAWSIFSHVQARVDGWLNAFDQEIYNRSPGGSYQLVQGLFGMAKGGLLGTGLGHGSPHLVPWGESDFIYASLGEELGLAGLLAIMMCYMILTERAFRTAIGVRDGFGKLLASGLGFVMCLQTFVVVAGVTRVLPLTGLTMPFLAYGGSSLIANWTIIGLLLRISDAARRPTPAAGPKYVTEEGATAALDIKAMRAAIASGQLPEGLGERPAPTAKNKVVTRRRKVNPEDPTSRIAVPEDE